MTEEEQQQIYLKEFDNNLASFLYSCGGKVPFNYLMLKLLFNTAEMAATISVMSEMNNDDSQDFYDGLIECFREALQENVNVARDIKKSMPFT